MFGISEIYIYIYIYIFGSASHVGRFLLRGFVLSFVREFGNIYIRGASRVRRFLLRGSVLTYVRDYRNIYIYIYICSGVFLASGDFSFGGLFWHVFVISEIYMFGSASRVGIFLLQGSVLAYVLDFRNRYIYSGVLLVSGDFSFGGSF